MAFEREREEMVAEQLEARGIRDARVLDAMRRVPRHRFVPPELLGHAYDDTPLPIGEQQTISQPYIVALMSEALELPRRGRARARDRYRLGLPGGRAGRDGCAACSPIELLPGAGAPGPRRARGAGNRRPGAGGGRRRHAGLARTRARTTAIIVTAGAPRIPRPLLAQLAPAGCLVLPIGERDVQTLVRLRRGAQGLIEDYLGDCRFVKLHGAYGWDEH